jgi:hypothetical protein
MYLAGINIIGGCMFGFEFVENEGSKFIVIDLLFIRFTIGVD